MAKSPVYGLGRNRKHRAPGGPFHAAAADINMRGKKEKIMSCQCCICIDMRDGIVYTIHKREMKDERDS
jgi:hypothetical protein